MNMAIRIAIKVMMAAIIGLAILQLTGCCTYHGKAVSRRNAEQMRKLGMDVTCPGDTVPDDPGSQRTGGDVIIGQMVPDKCDPRGACNVGKKPSWPSARTATPR